MRLSRQELSSAPLIGMTQHSCGRERAGGEWAWALTGGHPHARSHSRKPLIRVLLTSMQHSSAPTHDEASDRLPSSVAANGGSLRRGHDLAQGLTLGSGAPRKTTMLPFFIPGLRARPS